VNAVQKELAWSLDIPIGLPLQAQIINENMRFKSVYYGMKPGEFLVVQMPGIPGIREKLLSQASLVVRFVIAGKVYGFKSSVLSHVTRPCPLIFITFPHSIETINLRSTERVDTFLAARGKMGDDALDGVILDLSAGGCRYVVNRTTGLAWPNIELGMNLTLAFTLDNGDGQHELQLDSEVVMAKKEVDKFNLGLRFSYTDENVKLKQTVQAYIDHMQRFMRGQN